MRTPDQINLIIDNIIKINTPQRNLDWYGNPSNNFLSREAIDSGECAWPELALTMIGRKRLINIAELCQKVVDENIAGSFVECGAWRGGACMMARACLPTDRTVWVCDSFCGFPASEPEHHWTTYTVLSVSKKEVMKNFETFDLLNNTRFVEGFFEDSLKQVTGQIAVLRIDVDSYKNTIDCLKQLWPSVSPGGYLIFDEFLLDSVQGAATSVIGKLPEPVWVDRMCAFIKK